MKPYYKFHLDNYLLIKKKLIHNLELEKYQQLESKYEKINKTDWGISQDLVFEKKWSQIFFQNFYNQIELFYRSMGYTNFYIDAIWFQEYLYGGFHDWHDHSGSDFSNIFFLNFNKKNYGTEFMIDNKIIKAEVSEGDLIIFPGDLKHRAPENFSDNNRLVIVFNTKIY